jgi:hypothetical protein
MAHAPARAGLALLALLASTQAQILADTVGYTSRDRQMYGPAVRYIANDTSSGIHAVWKDGLGLIRYNFRPRRGNWRWPNGVEVNSDPHNLGSMDVDISNGRAVISADHVVRNASVAVYFKDNGPGSGVFREDTIGTGYRHCLVGTTNYGWTKFGAVMNDTFFYCTVLGGYPVGKVGPFPAVNLAVSKLIGRYGYIWAATEDPGRGALFLKQTPNNGANWYATVALSDSVPSPLSRSMLGACATYDSIKVHLVADLYDGQDPHRSQIWHYCPYDTPAWHLIQDYACPESTQLGDYALAATRPSIGMDRRPHELHTVMDRRRHELYTVWEQFDPANIDPSTGLARADIWAARSCDQGLNWGEPVRLTVPDNTSKRFPFLAEVVDDTLRVLYFADKVAGFWEQGQGVQTTNAVVYLRVAADFLPTAVQERPDPGLAQEPAEVRPSVARRGFEVRPAPGVHLLHVRVADESGRIVAEPAVSRIPLSWGASARPGVYFLHIATDHGDRTVRVTKIR